MSKAVTPSLNYQTKIMRGTRTRTARLEVHAGVVSVKVPKTCSDTDIEALLFDHQAWIAEQLQGEQTLCSAPDRVMQNGAAIPYLGKNYRLKINIGNPASVRLIQGRLQICAPSIDDITLRQLLTDWYQQQAKLRLTAKTVRFAKILGVIPGAINVRSLRLVWSDRSVKGKLQFHWNLVTAPHSVINYVVVHALCQLKYPDLGAHFWQAVEGIIVDSQTCRDWVEHNAPPFEL